MQLTLYTGYSLRTLVYLGVVKRSATISEIAGKFGISRNHLSKVCNNLSHLGFIHSTQGKGGGLKLAMDPAVIRIGEVVRRVEPNFTLAECFDPVHDTCPLAPACGLKRVFADAKAAFLESLDQYTLEDMLANAEALAEVLHVR